MHRDLGGTRLPRPRQHARSSPTAQNDVAGPPGASGRRTGLPLSTSNLNYVDDLAPYQAAIGSPGPEVSRPEIINVVEI
jgi:hypothetical protein